MEMKCLRIARGFQYQQLSKVLLEGKTVGCDRMQEFCIPLQIRPSAVNGVLDGVSDGLNDALLIVKDDAPHTKRTGREHILRFVIDKYDRTGVGAGIVEDMPVKPEVGLSFAGVGGGIDFVEQGPVRWFCPEILVVWMGDVGHGIYPEFAIRLELEFVDEIEHFVI